jgi:hypothetical protein
MYATQDISHYLIESSEYEKDGYIQFKRTGGYGYATLSRLLAKVVKSGKLEVNYNNKKGDTLLSNLQSLHSELLSKDEDKDVIDDTQAFIELLKQHGAKS